MNVLRAVIVPLTILLAAGACAHTGSSPNTASANIHARETTVRVTNNNWSTMAVYVVRLGMRTRIGTVESMRTEVLRVPRPLVSAAGDIRLLADPIGSTNRYLTPIIQVSPGQRIDFKVENQLTLSSVSVWHR